MSEEKTEYDINIEVINNDEEVFEKEITLEEEAALEEERLDKMVESFFSNPENILTQEIYKPELEGYEEEDIVEVSNDGQVVSEEDTSPKTGDLNFKEAEMVSKPSFVDQQALRYIILKRIKKMNDAYDEIQDKENLFYRFTGGSSLFDNFCDMYRKEKNALNSLLLKEVIDLKELNNSGLERSLLDDVSVLMGKVFTLCDVD